MPNLKIGYKAPAEQFGPSELVNLAVLADDRGLDSVWVSDHFQPWRDKRGHAPSSLAFLAAAGARTQKVILGTSVLTPTLRYNPAVIAQTFATLGCLTPGRIILGVGTGEAMNEHAVSGETFPEFKERYGRLREAIQLIRALWSGDRTSFDGVYYRTIDAKLYDTPDRAVPIYIAAGGPQMAKYVGGGIICTSGKGMDLYTDRLLPAADEGRAAAPDSTAGFGRMIEIKLSYDRARNGHWRTPGSGLHCRCPPRTGMAHRLPGHRTGRRHPAHRAGRPPMDRRVRPSTAMAGIQSYVNDGLTHLVFHPPCVDRPRFFDQFCEDILPRLRTQ